MKNFLIFVLVVSFISITINEVKAFEKAGMHIPDTMYSGKNKLVLNGVGVRKKFGFKAYVAALYLPGKSHDNKYIINSDLPMTFTMHWRYKAGPRKIKLVFFKSFAISVNAKKEKIYNSESDYGELSESIIKFVSWMAEKETNKFDTWTYRYKPGEGTYVYIYYAHNETEKFAGIIPGLKFKKALLNIWLGDKQAVGERMKNNLLGLP